MCKFPNCSKCFKTVSQLKYHNSAHLNLREFKCEVCHIGFNRKSTLKIHSMSHSGDKPYKCLYCKRSFSQKSNWRKHTDHHLIVIKKHITFLFLLKSNNLISLFRNGFLLLMILKTFRSLLFLLLCKNLWYNWHVNFWGHLLINY